MNPLNGPSDYLKASLLGGAGFIFLLGLMLCLTCVGAIVGLPLIATSLTSITNSRKGACPDCGTELVVIPTFMGPSGFRCHACRRHLVAQNGTIEPHPGR